MHHYYRYYNQHQYYLVIRYYHYNQTDLLCMIYVSYLNMERVLLTIECEHFISLEISLLLWFICLILRFFSALISSSSKRTLLFSTEIEILNFSRFASPFFSRVRILLFPSLRTSLSLLSLLFSCLSLLFSCLRLSTSL